MAPHDMPAAEVDLSAELVRSLLAAQHPDLAGLEIVELANGWDNVMYRLGDELTVRLPRRAAAASLIANEQAALPQLADRLPIPIPAPVFVGQPALGYPWQWSVTPWFHGDVAARATLGDPGREAARLGEFFAALHVEALDDAPPNPFRGHFIGRNESVFLERVAQIDATLDALVAGGADAVRRRWSELTEAPAYDGDPVWLHADLHTANMVVHNGEISAVIDFGDVCAGDPATDYAVAWMLFDAGERSILRETARVGGRAVDDAAWRRGEAWALHFAVMYLAMSGGSPLMCSIGERLIAALFADLSR